MSLGFFFFCTHARKMDLWLGIKSNKKKSHGINEFFFLTSLWLVGWLDDIIVCLWHHLYRLRFVRNNLTKFEFCSKFKVFSTSPCLFHWTWKEFEDLLTSLLNGKKNSRTSRTWKNLCIVTNLPSFICLYKFCVKSSIHIFLQ